jgi:hypothetical protein
MKPQKTITLRDYLQKTQFEEAARRHGTVNFSDFTRQAIVFFIKSHKLLSDDQLKRNG